MLAVGPFLWMLSTAFMPRELIYSWPPHWFPTPPSLEHFVDLFGRIPFARNFVNSLVVTLGITALSLMVNALAGFAFAKYRFPGRDRLFILLILTMMIPGQVTMIPVFLLLKSIGLLNSPLGLIIPAASSVFGIFLIRQFMMGLPDAYLESARIDGCTEWGIFWAVALPLSKPVLAALAIFTFMGAWSDFLFPLIVLHEERMYTLPVALANLNGQHGTEWGLLMAGALLVILPIAIVFLVMQRRFVEGITFTGMKG
jgi:multiple sugar transport system permease protein